MRTRAAQSGVSLLGFIFVAIISFMPEGLVPGSVRLWRLAFRGARGKKPLPKRADLKPGDLKP